MAPLPSRSPLHEARKSGEEEETRGLRAKISSYLIIKKLNDLYPGLMSRVFLL